MPEPQRCPSCNREMPANAPAGLCPACLLGGVLDSQSPESHPKATAGDIERPTASRDVDRHRRHSHPRPFQAVRGVDRFHADRRTRTQQSATGDDRSFGPAPRFATSVTTKIRGELGRGGMGVVSRPGRSVSVGRVALKMIRAGRARRRGGSGGSRTRSRRSPSSIIPTSCRFTRSAITRAALLLDEADRRPSLAEAGSSYTANP